MSDINQRVLDNWQEIVDILAESLDISAALITEAEGDVLKLLKANSSEENPFQEGVAIKLAGQYCERTLKEKKMVEVNNIQKHEWMGDIEVNYDMISYLGYPIFKPDGEVFGTLCVLDNKERKYSDKSKKLMQEFKNLIEKQLENIYLYGLSRSILDSMNANIVILDHYGVIHYTNKSWDEFAENNGLSKEQVGLGTNYLEVCRKSSKNCEKVSEVYQGIKSVMSGEKESYTIEYTSHSPEEEHWYNMTVTPFVGSNVYSVVIIHEDITQRKLAERELKLQKEKLDETLMRYQMATNGAKLGVWDWNITTDEVKFNEMWSKMLDYEPDEIEGDFKSWENMIHPDDKERVFEKLNEHLRGESPFYQSEHRLKTGDGYWKWIYDIGSIVEYGTDSKPVRAVGIHQDINARKRSEEVVNTHKAYFQQLFDRSPEAIVILDNEERIMRINESFKRIFGYESSEIEGANINEIILPPDKKKEAELISDKVKNGQVYTGESARQAKTGRLINVNIKGYPIIIDNEQSGIYEIYEDITDRKIEEDKIKYLSFHDQLTDLYNRRYFENELERLSSTRKTPLSIIIGDLDGLKTVNDNLGHKEGDKYIKKAAEVIRSVIRSDDIAARIGGDEFAIILPDTEENESREIVKRIRKLFQENCSEYPGISLGLGVKENPEQNINKVFKTADRNMYYNKREKKRT